jgi:ferritin
MTDKLNEQIKNELFSGHYYLSMAAYCASLNFNGFANFFIVQEQEERFHGMKIFNYIIEKNQDVKIIGLDQPKTEFKSLEEVFDLAWKHEQHVTKLIYKLMDAAVKENDFGTQSFLKWFVDEQVEEEATMLDILDKIKFFGDEKQGLYLLDKELAARTFAPPPAE